MRRASTVPASMATTRPSPISSAMRTSWSRIGVSACAVGCSKNTCQLNRGTMAEAVSTSWPLPSLPEVVREPARAAVTCGRAARSLSISGPLLEEASTSPWASTTKAIALRPTWASPR